jgi:hypothetical protein
MVKVTAATSFLGNEGMWRAGETKEVSNHRAEELIQQGYAIEAANQGDADLQAEPTSPLQLVANALGASVAEPLTDQLAPAADALGASLLPNAPADTEGPAADRVKQDKAKGKTKEDKAKGETKEAK